MSIFHRFLLFLILFSGSFSILQDDAAISISNPTENQIVQGIVEVRGSIPIMEYKQVNLAFSYSGENVQTWFLIDTISKTGNNILITRWDTTTISDGIYDLKLSTIDKEGITKDFFVTGIRVMNYSRTESAIARVTDSVNDSTILANPTQAEKQGMTQKNRNSASISRDELTISLVFGVLSAVFILILMLLYQKIRKHGSRR